MMNAFGTLTSLLLTLSVVGGGQSSLASYGVDHPADAKLIRPSMLVWATGLVETITPAVLNGRKTWRVTHYPQDPADTRTNDYDLYDLDRNTLAPVRSVRNTDEYRLELLFSKGKVILDRTAYKNKTTEEIPLTTAVQAEGPGLDVFVAGLPLTLGYKLRYAIVDRWGGHGTTRVKPMTLSVSSRTTEVSVLGKRDVYKVAIWPDDNSFQIDEKVLADGPHFPLWVKYTRDGKTYPPSEVVAIID